VFASRNVLMINHAFFIKVADAIKHQTSYGDMCPRLPSCQHPTELGVVTVLAIKIHYIEEYKLGTQVGNYGQA
tara:strand:- start:56847 stop:57065 length:219 start_codon:yes stop_codon:yes gene_type:complete